jgi:hypothetical protein
VGGFKKEEIVNFLLSFEKILHDTLLTRSEMKSLQDRIYNYITLTMQFAIDEIEDMYELMEQEKVEKNTYKVHADQKEVLSSEDLQRLVRRLEHVCGDPFQTSV